VRALEVRSADDFCKKLGDLEPHLENEASSELIMLVYPVLDHFETFVTFFVNMMLKAVDVSMVWGLLFLVINVREMRLTLNEN
jgi:hypothetical protein